jgi:hypothetical protein
VNPKSGIDSLASETVEAFQRAAGDAEALKGVLFLYLNRAYEAGLEPDTICDLLGVLDNNILERAGLSPADETVILDAYRVIDPILARQYKSGL